MCTTAHKTAEGTECERGGSGLELTPSLTLLARLPSRTRIADATPLPLLPLLKRTQRLSQVCHRLSCVRLLYSHSETRRAFSCLSFLSFLPFSTAVLLAASRLHYKAAVCMSLVPCYLFPPLRMSGRCLWLVDCWWLCSSFRVVFRSLLSLLFLSPSLPPPRSLQQCADSLCVSDTFQWEPLR